MSSINDWNMCIFFNFIIYFKMSYILTFKILNTVSIYKTFNYQLIILYKIYLFTFDKFQFIKNEYQLYDLTFNKIYLIAYNFKNSDCLLIYPLSKNKKSDYYYNYSFKIIKLSRSCIFKAIQKT